MPHQQGSNTDTVTQLDLQAMDPNQGGSSTYSSLNSGVPSTTGSTWTLQWPGNSSTENGAISNSSIHHGQQTEPLVRDGQGGQNAASQAIGSSSYGSSHGPQEHAGVASYSSSTDAYGYDTPGYQGYYYGYQQQTSNTYPQQVGVYQNSGAPYQPITSFQNSGSYSGSTSYSSTYYNTGDYQTTGSYPSGGTSNQATSWNDGSYASYPTHQYSNYNSSDSIGTHSSTTVAAAPLSYEQQYKQWADYYSHTASEISCAPGTENVSTAAGYPPPDNQPPPPGTTSWRKEQSSLESSSLQAGVLTGPGDTPNAYWGHGTPTLQNHHGSNPSSYSKTSSYGQTPSYSQTPSQTQTPSYSQTPSQTQTPSYSQTQSQTNTPSYSQMPSQTQTPSYGHMPSSYNQTPTTFSQTPSQKSLQSNPVPYDFQNLPKAPCPQGSNLQYRPMHQIPQHYNPTVQPASSFDAQKVNKVQIPTNPRIASNLAFGLPIIEKDTPTTETAIKPAYVSVSMPKSDNKVLSRDASDSMLKPGMFPASLRAYVERALARCKNDLQKTACQTIMKEMITKASADGTLFTRNWDIEPLFPLPDMDTCIKESLQDSNTVCSLPKYKRSPSRRTKSRWEPLAEEKLVEKLASVNNSSWDNAKEREKTVSAGNYEGKVDGWSTSKFLQSQLQNQSKNSQRPFKKPRFSDINSVTENGDASSDSEKEQGLTAYYSGAVALANSPEERKRRESRSKRFEKGQGQRAEIKHFRPKAVGGGNVYTKRPTAMVIGKSYEDGGNRAVEDIDWDSLTVKGSCQEIEKRYLRLTSAPDPATVRPEDVLEKSLQMVRSSQKNYLYKCDQLKSIRQDLTVQRIRNELTVKVYETHARLALEAGDLPEYNQCASQLKILYGEGIKGCHMEFSAYNLLCVILHSNNSRDLVSSMARLSGETKNDEAVKHALAVRAAVTSGNYVLFFKLYKTAPNLNICLMDLHVEKMRFEAVKCMSRSYRPTVPLTFITQVLGFMDSLPSSERHNEKDTDAMEECEEWLRAHGACLIVDNSGDMLLDTKVSASTLFMPEPEDAVAHGDTNLAVNDFMTRTT